MSEFKVGDKVANDDMPGMVGEVVGHFPLTGYPRVRWTDGAGYDTELSEPPEQLRLITAWADWAPTPEPAEPVRVLAWKDGECWALYRRPDGRLTVGPETARDQRDNGWTEDTREEARLPQTPPEPEIEPGLWVAHYGGGVEVLTRTDDGRWVWVGGGRVADQGRVRTIRRLPDDLADEVAKIEAARS